MNKLELGSKEHDEEIQRLVKLGEKKLKRMEADISFALRCIRDGGGKNE